jgi:uncharacterized protein (TIGR02145 family)
MLANLKNELVFKKIVIKNNFILILLIFSSLIILTNCSKEKEDIDDNIAFQYKGGAFAPSDEEINALSVYNYATNTNVTYGTSHSLRNLMPIVRDQGEQTSCMAFAIGYYLQSYNQKIEFNHSYSKATQMSPSFLYNQGNKAINNILLNNCRTSGSEFIKMLEILKNQGICNLNEMTYMDADCSVYPSSTAISNAYENRILEYYNLFHKNLLGNFNINEAQRISYTKANIYQGVPVIIGYDFDSNWESQYDDYPSTSDVIYSNHSSNPDKYKHASLVVGYDDNVGVNGAFQIVNSYGIEWANDGYFWIDYDFFTQIVFDAFVVTDYIASTSAPSGCEGTFVDSRDGQQYCYVTIGSQVWMAENLNYDAGAGAWCYNETNYYCNQYGRFYNWNTLMNGSLATNNIPSGVQGVCPNGWHVPSRYELQELIDNYPSLTGNAAYAALITGGSSNYNIKLGGNLQFYSGNQLNFYNLTYRTGIWSTSNFNTLGSMQYYLNFYSNKVYLLGSGTADYGYYCRCVKD